MDTATGYGQEEPEKEEGSEVRTMEQAMKGQRKAWHIQGSKNQTNKKRKTNKRKNTQETEKKEGNRREDGGVIKCLHPRSRFRRGYTALMPFSTHTQFISFVYFEDYYVSIAMILQACQILVSRLSFGKQLLAYQPSPQYLQPAATTELRILGELYIPSGYHLT